MELTNSDKFLLAKTFTELAIQNDLITHWQEPEATAKEVTTFFNTVYETLDSKENK
ncbi:MAG: hypothetical protein J6J38_07680 [Lachnospiraceae bacterium]|nr:hypothetical protein [Lachnospiraceae bacterium]